MLDAKSGLSNETASGGGSKVVNEHLHVMPLQFFFWLLSVFALRFDTAICKSPASWRKIVMVFLAKQQAPYMFKHFRGIALLEIVSKFYMGTVVICLQKQIRRTRFTHSVMFVYTKNRSSAEVVLILNKILATLYEWRNVVSGVVFSGDIAQAFDSCPILSVCEALFAAGAHPKTIVAFLREQLELTLCPSFSGLQIDEVCFEGILRQGGKDGPFAWNIFLAWLLDKIATLWSGPNKRYGIDLEHRRITHMTWSDNIFLFARDRDQLKCMLEDLTQMFGRHNLKWKTSELLFLQGGVPTSEKERDKLSFDICTAQTYHVKMM